jgi:hypothetical protein
MFGNKLRQQIKVLKHEHQSLEWEMAEVYNSTADPDMMMYHLSELQCMQLGVEEEIEALEHELAMIPLRFMLGGFVVVVIAMIIYMIL